MRSVYAVLIGIAEYPPEVSRLYGCANDTRRLDLYFTEIFTEKNGFRYQPIILLNNQATRQAIIDSFSVFDAAASDDICIFYYSGHGSLVRTNAIFLTDGSDYLNSLVCYDSRSPGGSDLMDKELAYLIWKTTTNKPNLHFVSIMDCCFAGSNTRDVTETSRMFSRNETIIEAKHLLGFDHFVNGLPPRGRYLALSASQQKQTSKEKIISGDVHGVFTYSLVNCLKELSAGGDYRSLVDKVTLLTRLHVRDQQPMLEAFQMDDSAPVFGIAVLPRTKAYMLYYQDGWYINKGMVHGVKSGDVLRLENGEAIAVTVVQTSDSKVTIDIEPGREQIHPVFPQTTIAVSLRFYIADHSGIIQTILEKAMHADQYEGITFSGDAQNAHYHIRYDVQGRLAMTDPEPSSLPRFKTVHAASAAIFLDRLQHVARWASVVNLFNPEGSGFAELISFEIFSATKTSVIKIDDPSGHVFRYEVINSHPVPPSVRMVIKNNHQFPVYISLLYCSCDFSVADGLLSNQVVDAGHEIVASYTKNNGVQSDIIPIRIPGVYIDAGILKVTEYVILLASKTPVASSDFKLSKLPLEHPEPDRKPDIRLRGVGGASPAITKPLWGTLRIQLHIEIS